MTLYEDLKWRGLIKDVVGEESDLQKILDGNPFSFYWGTDPTADRDRKSTRLNSSHTS